MQSDMHTAEEKIIIIRIIILVIINTSDINTNYNGVNRYDSKGFNLSTIYKHPSTYLGMTFVNRPVFASQTRQV